MKALTAAIVSLFALTAHAERAIHVNVPRVDLTQPGAAQSLKDADPRRYERVMAALEKVSVMPCRSEGPGLIKTTPANPPEPYCAAPVLTSFPAKRHVTIRVDNTIYDAIVTLRDSGGKLVHAVQ
jgi:hypothetical protein